MGHIRVKCSCGNVMNAQPGGICSKCKQTLNIPEEGMIMLYRKGSPIGIAGGFGLYINNEPMGYIGNKETLYIPLKYGTYTLHVAAGMNRRCNDLTFNLTPENPKAYAKVSMRMGFLTNKFVLEVSCPEEMPQ